MFGAVKSAIFVDFDNVGSDAMRRSVANWMAWLEDGAFRKGEKKRRFVMKRVYWNGKKDDHRQYFEKEGYEAFACRPLAANKNQSNDKSASDLRLAIHAADSLRNVRGLKEVFIFSCDTDFVPLVDMMSDNDIRVVALGNEGDPSSAIYRDHADVVISTRELKEAFDYRRVTKARRPEGKSVTSGNAAVAGATSAKTPVERAAEVVVQLAARTPGLPVARKTIIKALESMPELEKQGPRRWLGCGNYENLIAAILKVAPALKKRPTTNGGYNVLWDD